MSNSYTTTPRTPGFFRSLVFLVLSTAAIVVLLAYLEAYQTNLNLIFMTAFAVTVLGLTIGLGTRLIFYHFSGFVRYSIAVLVLPPSMFALGFFTAWEMGFGPLDPWLAGKLDWFELVQLAWALLVILISLHAWWKPTSKVDEIAVSENYSSNHRESARIRASVQLPRFNPPRFHLPESWTAHPRGIARPKITRSIRAKERLIPEINRVVIPKPAKPVRARHRKSRNRKPDVQFSVYEEHRCPYCLDVVKRNDTRGVKECEVCHSLHHADCWNITGMCQVPHLNS
jgi:hypothetical protein